MTEIFYSHSLQDLGVTVSTRFTGRLRWGKDGSLQQEVEEINHKSGVSKTRWEIVKQEI